jgi:adenine-specific DNA-methyltransferase
VELSEQEKQEIQGLIARNEPLPDKYRWKLFAEPRETELIWPGKTQEVETAVLPFQVIEQVDEPRPEKAVSTPDLFAADEKSGRQSGGWSNKLIWGDNKLVLSSLKNGPLRREIEKAGGLKLVYIDPPFDVGADFSFEIEVGGNTLTKEPSVVEDIAYRDTWGRGKDSYLSMFRERLFLISQLMADAATIYIHCDWRLNSALRLVAEECFGRKHYLAEIKWKRVVSTGSSKSLSKKYPVADDSILFFAKSESYTWNPCYVPFSDEYKRRFTERDERGVFYWDNLNSYSNDTLRSLIADNRIKLPITPNRNPRYKNYLHERKGAVIDNLWTDIPSVNSQANEDTSYATQKPEALLERIISASSNPGDLVADFFCGSGTTLAVAEKLGRKWIGCDLGRFAIHTSRKRMIGVQRELKKAHKPYRAFEILNLGKYERQYFAGIDPTLPEAQRRALSIQKEEHFTGLILSAYKAERIFQSPPFHGRKGKALVLVGPIDAPVTQSLVREAVAAALKLGITDIDILGFEFEMGLIPRAAEVKTRAKGRTVTVSLADFAVYYRQEDADQLAGGLKPGGTKVTVDNGQVVKIAKDRQGIITREVLTKQWMDWIDYWCVDFNYRSKQEIITVTSADGQGRMVDRPQWTGGYVFENEWQSFRTRRDRSLELTSTPHEYPAKGSYFIAVKVIDIFGNDTTKVVEVTV